MKEHLILGTNLAPKEGYSVIYGLNDVAIGICSDSTYKDLMKVCTKLPIGSLVKVFNKDFKVSKDFISSLTGAVKGIGIHANVSMILIDAITLLDKSVPLTKENIEILLNAYYDIFDSAYFRLLEINGNAKMFDNTKQSVRFQNAFHTRSRLFDGGKDDYGVDFSLDLDEQEPTSFTNDDSDYDNLTDNNADTLVVSDSPFAEAPIVSGMEEEVVRELPDLNIDLSSETFNRTEENISLEDEDVMIKPNTVADVVADDLVEDDDLLDDSSVDDFNLTSDSLLEETEVVPQAEDLNLEDDSFISTDKDLEDDFALTEETTYLEEEDYLSSALQAVDTDAQAKMEEQPDLELNLDFLKAEEEASILVEEDIFAEPIIDAEITEDLNPEDIITDDLLLEDAIEAVEETPTTSDSMLEELLEEEAIIIEEPIEEPVEEPVEETVQADTEEAIELEEEIEEEPVAIEPIHPTTNLTSEEVYALTEETGIKDMAELTPIDISNPKIDLDLDPGERNISIGYTPVSTEIAKDLSADERFSNIEGYDVDLTSYLDEEAPEEDEVKAEVIIDSKEEVAVSAESVIVLEEAEEPIVLTEEPAEDIMKVTSETSPLTEMPTSEIFHVESKELKHKDIGNIPDSAFKAKGDIELSSMVKSVVTEEIEKLKKNVLIDVSQLNLVLTDVTKRLQRIESNTLLSPMTPYPKQVTQSARTVSRELVSSMPIFEDDYEPLRETRPFKPQAPVKALSEIDSEVGYVYKAIASSEAKSHSTSNSSDLSDKEFDAINDERRAIIQSVLKSRGEI